MGSGDFIMFIASVIACALVIIVMAFPLLFEVL
jgi:hypothetical protein